MGLHQIIYTSCKRGITGVNDGQQVFSFDKAFSSYKNTGVESMFAYQPFMLSSGQRMTDDLVSTFPRAFIYRRLDKGMTAVALNSYLGRDYMGENGRFGNTLSHVIVSDEAFETYPCNFYGSSSFRKKMKFEDVNNSNTPAFLDTPDLTEGDIVDSDSIIEFLEIGNRLEIYKNMLYAVISRKSSKKRVLIHDDPENIIMWISAIMYSLPLKIALNINFSTYEFNASVSKSYICGVYPEQTTTQGNNGETNFLFDIENSVYPTFEKDEDYYDFMDTVMSISYDSVTDFFDFLNQFEYNELDEDIYSAYQLYKIFTDEFSGKSENLKTAISFAEKYGSENTNADLVKSLLGQNCFFKNLIPNDFLYFAEYISKYIRRLNSDYIDRFIEINIGYLFDKLVYVDEEFNLLYKKMYSICHDISINLMAEIIKNKNILFSYLGDCKNKQFIDFVISVIHLYAIEVSATSNDLDQKGRIGSLYFELVLILYQNRNQLTVYATNAVLENVDNNPVNIIKTSMNFIGIDENNVAFSKEIMNQLAKVLLLKCEGNFDETWRYMLYNYDMAYLQMLFESEIKASKEVKTASRVFSSLYNTVLRYNPEFKQTISEFAATEYYKKLLELNADPEIKCKLLYFVCNHKISGGFAVNLIDDVVRSVSVLELIENHKDLIRAVCSYCQDQLYSKPHDKLLLGFFTATANDVVTVYDLTILMNNIKKVNNNIGIPVSGLTADEFTKIIISLVKKMISLGVSERELVMLHNMFVYSNIQQDLLFYKLSSECYIEECNAGRHFVPEAYKPYFEFVLSGANVDICKAVRGTLQDELNKKKRELLFDFFEVTFTNNSRAMNLLTELSREEEKEGFFKKMKRKNG